jgi:hypothetical protein
MSIHVFVRNACKIGLIITNLSWKCNEKYGINMGILRVENDFCPGKGLGISDTGLSKSHLFNKLQINCHCPL